MAQLAHVPTVPQKRRSAADLLMQHRVVKWDATKSAHVVAERNTKNATAVDAVPVTLHLMLFEESFGGLHYLLVISPALPKTPVLATTDSGRTRPKLYPSIGDRH